MLILLCYFSGTGNTKFIADTLTSGFRQRNCKVNQLAITSGKISQKILVDGYDLIGIGYPTHAFNAPKIIYEFISSLPLNSKKRVFLFRSAGDPVISAGGTAQLRSHLDNHGLRVFMSVYLLCPPMYS